MFFEYENGVCHDVTRQFLGYDSLPSILNCMLARRKWIIFFFCFSGRFGESTPSSLRMVGHESLLDGPNSYVIWASGGHSPSRDANKKSLFVHGHESRGPPLTPVSFKKKKMKIGYHLRPLRLSAALWCTHDESSTLKSETSLCLRGFEFQEKEETRMCIGMSVCIRFYDLSQA